MTVPTILRTGALACAAGALLAGAPATAGAATLHREGDTLVYTAGAGVTNWPVFSQETPGTLHVEDSGEHLHDGAGCTVTDPEYPTEADCPMPAKLRLELGDGGDRAMLLESLPPIPVHVLGQGGSDGLSSNYDVDNRVVLDGGEGDDTLSGYRFGETLVGGPGNDAITGGAGDDVLRGDEGDDALEPDTSVDVQGDDVVDGGAGFDSVKDWGSSSTDPSFRVNVSVDGVADDGRPGERDNVTAVERFDALTPGRYVLADSADSIDLPNYGTSSVEGRGGDDGLSGNDGAETIDGGAGSDRVEGGFGHDTLTGGPGSDTIYGDETSQRCVYDSCVVVPYGNDTIQARDGEIDTIDCGVGTDRAVVDAHDVLANCETVERGDPGTGGAAGPATGGPAGPATGGAADPGTGGPAGPATAVARKATVALARRTTLRAALRRGLAVRVSGGTPGRRTVVGRHRGRRVARATVTVPATGRVTARLRFTPAAKRKLSRRRSAVLVVSTGGARLTVRLR